MNEDPCPTQGFCPLCFGLICEECGGDRSPWLCGEGADETLHCWGCANSCETCLQVFVA